MKFFDLAPGLGIIKLSWDSGGFNYDENENVVGIIIAQLNKMKFANMSGASPENVNFGIKVFIVRQFLTSSGSQTKWSALNIIRSYMSYLFRYPLDHQIGRLLVWGFQYSYTRYP